MLKNDVAVVGAGLGGATVAYGLQQKNYRAYLINGSEQDNRTIPDAKNVLILEGYDGLAGDRSLALEALQRNKQILKTISEIEQKIVLCVASGGGSTGSGNLPYICDILAADSERIVVPIVLMPRKDEPIQKRLNAYNLAKDMSMIKERAARHNMHLEEAVGCGAMGWMVVDQNNVIQTDEHGMSLEELDEYFKE